MGAKTVKIMHISDVRLGEVFPMMSPERSAVCRERHLAALCEAIDKEVKGGVRLVLISGNLFASPLPEPSVTDILLGLWLKHSNIQFVITPAMLDAGSPVYTMKELPENVHVITSSTVKRLTLKECRVAIYGWQVKRGAKNPTPLRDKSADNTPLLKLAVGSGTPDGKGLYTITDNDIKSFGAHYCALGGMSDYSGVLTAGDCAYAYTGSFVSTDSEQHGYGGYMLLSADDEDGTWRVTARRREVRFHRYDKMSITLKDASTADAIKDTIVREVKAKKFGTEASLKITVSGNLPALLLLPTRIEALDGLLCSYEIIDDTLPLLDSEEMERDPTALGALFRKLKPKMKQGSKAKKMAAVRAFRTAMSALMATK